MPERRLQDAMKSPGSSPLVGWFPESNARLGVGMGVVENGAMSSEGLATGSRCGGGGRRLEGNDNSIRSRWPEDDHWPRGISQYAGEP